MKQSKKMTQGHDMKAMGGDDPAKCLPPVKRNTNVWPMRDGQHRSAMMGSAEMAKRASKGLKRKKGGY